MLNPLRSLRALTIAFIILFMTATAATGVASYFATHLTIRALVDRRISALSYAVEGVAPHDNLKEMIERIDDLAGERDTGDIGFLLIDPTGKRLGGNIELTRLPPAGFSTLTTADGLEGLSAGRALVRRVKGGLTLVTVGETEPFDNYDSHRLRIYLIGFGAIILIVLGGISLFGMLIAARIQAIRSTAEAIVDGDMRRRVPVGDGNDAFGQQARSFNRMLDRVTELMHGISNISNDVAHELRTPLARLRGQLSLIADETADAGERAKIGACIAECDTLLATFAAILRIAEVEGGDRRAGFARIDLGALAEEVATMMEPVAADDGRTIEPGPCPPTQIEGDRQLLTQLILNLIQNSLRHTQPGARIGVAVSREGKEARLLVIDNGPGIAAGERERAMRRFGRVGSGTERGHGLGLALVEAIARLHRGRVILSDAAPGLAVTVILPVA